ncbi:hypothetical protein VE03_03500 [Pseudogymnoascus sp. 23342-1-I1]|nr:hypothetical protein VE03_03500 [Pseudogymnoascus sp. 23342-1-I1]
MGKSKRDSASLDYDEPSKRPRHSSHAPPKEGTQGRIDPTYGQRSAFPGLDEEGGYATEDDDLDYGDDAGAISYLRAVRSEAAGIPTVLVAPKPILDGGEVEDRTIYDDGVGDSRGFYSDGAYTAAPDPQPDTPSDIPPAKHLRTKYFEKILERFGHLREQLGNTPPDHVVEKLDQNHDSYMSASAPDYRKWRWRVINTEPMNAQLARMDRATLLKLLRLLTNDKLAMGGSTIPTERLSRWIWGVLARLPVSGELNSEEIGLVRDLGKRAVWLGVVMNQPRSDTAARMPGDEDNDGEEDYEDEEEDGEVGKGFSISKLEDNDALGEVVEDRTEVGAHEPDVYALEVAGLDTPQTRVYDDGRDEEDEIAMEKLGLIAGRNPRPAVVEVPKPEEKGEDETLEVARARILAQLGGAGDTNATELAQAREALKEQELKERAREDEEDAARLLNAKATVDMIITVAGEIYGQRDLLEFRETWD